ncbi:hypothetical protein EDC24_2484 [Aquisalibacillus elongatus]|uniref:Uncharacterized protein n=1 Tax=Aquisalibacillus elongatus TaxID=485577 RepID=A0A3N5B1K4_9BACI|nr:hypothetical protein EDC24_2484 [Aquisalibacillus elongatus]
MATPWGVARSENHAKRNESELWEVELAPPGKRPPKANHHSTTPSTLLKSPQKQGSAGQKFILSNLIKKLPT